MMDARNKLMVAFGALRWEFKCFQQKLNFVHLSKLIQHDLRKASEVASFHPDILVWKDTYSNFLQNRKFF